MGAFHALRLGIAQPVVIPDDVGHVEQGGDAFFIGALLRLRGQLFLETGAETSPASVSERAAARSVSSHTGPLPAT